MQVGSVWTNRIAVPFDFWLCQNSVAKTWKLLVWLVETVGASDSFIRMMMRRIYDDDDNDGGICCTWSTGMWILGVLKLFLGKGFNPYESDSSQWMTIDDPKCQIRFIWLVKSMDSIDQRIHLVNPRLRMDKCHMWHWDKNYFITCYHVRDMLYSIPNIFCKKRIGIDNGRSIPCYL